MTTKHTLGPWATDVEIAVELLNKGERIDGLTIYRNDGSSSQGEEIATIRHDLEDGLDIRDPELQANAKLIAASPELLALAEIVNALSVPQSNATKETWIARGQEWLKAIQVARAAVAKATS